MLTGKVLSLHFGDQPLADTLGGKNVTTFTLTLQRIILLPTCV